MMKYLRLTIVFALTTMMFVAMPIIAQDDEQTSISFDGVSFTFPSVLGRNVNIVQYEGDPISLEMPGGPMPARTEFIFYTDAPAPNYTYEVPFSVTAYRLADLANYPLYQIQADALNTLLSNRPDLNTFEVATMGRMGDEIYNLPYLPVPNASQVIRANVNYVTTESFTGISYITAYRQDASPFRSGDFIYTLQAVSNDGSLYIAVTASVSTTAFPTDIPADLDYDAFINTYDSYMAQTIETLNQPLAGDTFTPTLAVFDAMFITFSN